MTVSPCDDCVANCCREYHILPSGHDVYRIASALHLPLSAFVSLRPRERREGEFKIRLSADTAVHHRLELGKIEDTGGKWTRRCVFLLAVGGRGRCGIYQVRPVECALYPFTGQADEVVLLRRRPYCPPGSWDSTPVDQPRNGPLLGQKETERRCLDRVIDEWNASLATRGPATEQDFFDHLLVTYESLARPGPSAESS